MNQKNFKPVSNIDVEIPEVPGLYCLRIKEKAGLSEPFSTVLEDRKHSIIYIGIASQSLRKRLNQEIRAKGHGTFFRSYWSGIRIYARKMFFGRQIESE